MGAPDTQKDDPRTHNGKAAPKKPDAPDPGKTTSTEPAGVTPAVPGKRTNTDDLDGGTPQSVGKSTQVDQGIDAKPDAKSGGGGGAPKADANHNAAAADDTKQGPGGKKGDAKAAGKDKGKGDKDAGTGKPTAGGKDDNGGAAAKGDHAKGGLYEPKPAQPAQRVDAAPPAAVPHITLDVPRPNKNLSDKWQLETGRTVEQHHEQIVGALAELQAEVSAKQTELMTLVDNQVTKITGEITAQVESFKSTLVAPGKARVEAAYGGLTKSFEVAEQKAIVDIAKHKTAGKSAIDTAKKSSGDGMSKKLAGAKAIVEQTIAKNTPTAAAAIKKWSTGIPGWVKSAKDQTKTATDTVANGLPTAGSTASKNDALVALEADVRRNHTIKHGEKLGKQYEASLLAWSKDTDKKADELVRKALDASKIEFDAALDVAENASKKGFEDGYTSATTSLDTAETTAKKSVTDAKVNGTNKFEAEKKEAVEAADKAGNDLADNATAAGVELTDRIKKKVSDDANHYAALVVDLQKQFKSGKPQQFEQAKPKIDNARAQLAKLHQTSTGELEQLVTDGKTTLSQTLARQQQEYGKAIKDREDSAKKTQAEVIKDIGKGVEKMGTSIGSLGKTFSDISEKESKRVDLMVTEFTKNADAATKDFGTKISDHLEGSRKLLEDSLKTNLEPGTIAADVERGVAGEVASKQKQLDQDKATLRAAMDGWGTDENKIYGVLRKCSPGEITYLEAAYNDHYRHRAAGGRTPLRADLHDEMSGNDLKTALAYLDHDRKTAIKLELADSKGFWNDDEERIEEVLRGCSEEEIHHLNSDPEAIKVVNDVKGNLGGADLDLMNTLLDQSIDKDDRKLKADAIGLFQAMDGLGTDEAKMKKLLSECKTEEERAKLRAHFNEYAKSKGWDGGTGTEDNDALTLAIKDEVSTFGGAGEQNHMLALASIKRDEDDIKAAKLVEAADGAGTDEDAIFEALDDQEYYQKWAAASPEEKKQLEEARRKLLDAKIAKMSDGKWDSAQGLIDDEMSKSAITYQEFIDGKHEDGTPLSELEKRQVKSRDPGINKLQWMVAQRKLQTGQVEPELMLAYAMWGVVGTDEDAIHRVLGPEPKSIADVNAITGAFQTRWGIPLVSHNELEHMQKGEPTGVLASELSGKDWFKTRMLLAGKAETAEQLKYLSDVRAKYHKGGLIASALMEAGEAVGYTSAKSDAEATETRFNEEYRKKFGKNPAAKLGTPETKELEELAAYLEQDYEAYSAALNSIVDSIVMAVEIVGGVIITIVTAGTASPVLAAIIANLVLSAGTITFKYAALGDQYGAAELGADIVKAVGTSAFAGLGELKALQAMTQNVGGQVAGGVQKLSKLANSAAAQAGMKLGEKGALEMGEVATKRLASIIAAGTKSVIIGAGQEAYNTLTDEKTYDKKLGDALWGEDSLGMKILKGIPKNAAEGAITQWVNEAAGKLNLDKTGKARAPRNALTHAVASMAGNTAGFFVYVDNYQNAEQFWVQLLKSNATKAISGALAGYAMHKTRAKRLGRDLINDPDNLAALLAALPSMDEQELRDLAKFVEKYGDARSIEALPDEVKPFLTQKSSTPADAAHENTAATSAAPAGGAEEAKQSETDQIDEAQAAQAAQDSDLARKQESDNTPIRPPGEQEAGLRGELDELWSLRGELRKAKPEQRGDLEAQIKLKQEALDVRLKDPTFKDSLLDPHVAFALAREAGSDGRSQALHDFLRTNIDSFRMAQDQAREGADPALRAKREEFEREVAKLVLAEGSPVKKQVDANLDELCLKAIDYIMKSRNYDEMDGAFARLGQKADTGYAGAVLQGDDVGQNAKVMIDVLESGNVRERMIALGKFAEFVANDMLNDPQRFKAVEEQSRVARPGEIGPAEVAAYRARMEQYLTDRGWKEGDPLPETKDFLKPTSVEKKGAQSEYQANKSQDMDTKIPSLSAAPVSDGDAFPSASLPAGKDGMTGSGEKSTLARTSITVAEAQAMGYQLSPREIEIANANGGRLPWVVGSVANVIDPAAGFIQAGAEHSLPQKAGISGTTFRFMEASALLGGDPEMSRLSMIGALQTIDAHTVYEIASASKGFGLGFDPKKPYDSLGIPRELLEQVALKTGTTLAELNGETANKPTEQQ
jgi:hypothetical protein